MKIGLTQTENPEKHQFYVEWLKANEEIEILTLSADKDNLDEINNCDALVLSGGIDVYPGFYGSNSIDYPGAPEKFNEKRDEFEIDVFKSALEKKLPVLGICRGMQLINVIHKGTLIQNLGDEELIKIHKGNPDKRHDISIGEETLLHDITGQTQGEINSAHHQSIDKLGKGLLINCRAEDGTIEGIEWEDKKDKAFMLAIQWHPERMFKVQLEDSPLSKTIRNRFIEEINTSKRNKK